MNTLFTTIILSFFCTLLTQAESPQHLPLPLSKSYWQDESFLKSFNASYRINANIEPYVSSEERALLVSIQKLMAEGKRESSLQKLTTNALMKTSAAVMFNAGNIAFELGDLPAAEKHYLNAIDQFPSFRRAHRNLGYIYAQQEKWQKALPALSEAIRLGDQDGATYGQLAYGRMHQQQYASALQAYRLAQLTQPENLDWKAGIAQCLQQLQRNDEALALLDEVITARPTEVAYYLLQASIYLSMEKPDDALVNLDFVRRLGKGKLDAENHLLLAQLHLQAGSIDLAKSMLAESLSSSRLPSAETLLNTLEMLVRNEHWDVTRDFLKLAEEAYPDSEKYQRKLRYFNARIDIESGAEPDRGAEILADLIQKDPMDAASLTLLARYHMMEEAYAEAEMFLQQAQRVTGYGYQAGVELAQLYVATGRYEDALSQLDEALSIKSEKSLMTYREAVAELVESQL
ncbi:MAG: tetratricopeptide repeat protein [Akkermansiaceae bacterium]